MDCFLLPPGCHLCAGASVTHRLRRTRALLDCWVCTSLYAGRVYTRIHVKMAGIGEACRGVQTGQLGEIHASWAGEVGMCAWGGGSNGDYRYYRSCLPDNIVRVSRIGVGRASTWMWHNSNRWSRGPTGSLPQRYRSGGGIGGRTRPGHPGCRDSAIGQSTTAVQQQLAGVRSACMYAHWIQAGPRACGRSGEIDDTADKLHSGVSTCPARRNQALHHTSLPAVHPPPSPPSPQSPPSHTAESPTIAQLKSPPRCSHTVVPSPLDCPL